LESLEALEAMASLRALRHLIHTQSPSRSNDTSQSPLSTRLLEVFLATFDLGFTAFGGPPVHFQILYRRFVEGISTRSRYFAGKQHPIQQAESTNANLKWVDPQTYQELFALVQALPGPASTKMLFTIAGLHAGWVAALMVFALWSLPGAIGMFALSLGVQQIEDTLPSIVYALLSGLNASTVGIIALAAVQLAEKAVVDKLSRLLVLFGACAGLCYNALWFFPMLVAVGGFAAGLWDTWLRQTIEKVRVQRRRRKEQAATAGGGEREEAGLDGGESIEMRAVNKIHLHQQGLQRRQQASTSADMNESARPAENGSTSRSVGQSPTARTQVDRSLDMSYYSISVATGIGMIAFAIALLIALLVSRSLIPDPVPRPLDLTANMYLAGTIIFGGGPVVIPLLREYVVQPGWVSSRDFLIGLAVIQAFPGPNFNFSVYLGALAMTGTGHSNVLGALLAYLGIFFPGIAVTVGVQGMWRVLRTKPVVVAVLRGINATAVGLVFTAVYRLWEIGYLTPEANNGQSLAMEPWWVVVAACSYAETAWFKVPPAAAIMIGGLLGLAWYGAVGN
jgi:chromate transport protein ChrA